MMKLFIAIFKAIVTTTLQTHVALVLSSGSVMDWTFVYRPAVPLCLWKMKR